MKKVLWIVSIVGLILTIVFSCQYPESTAVESSPNLTNRPYQGSISIDEAQDYFINSVLKSTPNAKRSGNDQYERDIDWKNAKKVKQENGLELVVAQVYYKDNKRPGVILWDDKASENAKKPTSDNLLRIDETLIAFRDKSGQMQTQIMQYIPDKEYKNRKKGIVSMGDFSGWVISRSWDEKLLTGFEFKDGKDIRQLAKTRESANGRKSSCDYMYMQNVSANCYPCGTNCTQCDLYISGSFVGTCTNPSSNSGTDGNGVGYGGSGGGNSGGNTSPEIYVLLEQLNTFESDFAVLDDYPGPRLDVTVNNPCQAEAVRVLYNSAVVAQAEYHQAMVSCLTESGFGAAAVEMAISNGLFNTVLNIMKAAGSRGIAGYRASLLTLSVGALTAAWCIDNNYNILMAKYRQIRSDFNVAYNRPCN